MYPPTPSKQEITDLLTTAMLHGGKMAHSLYLHELEEHLDYWTAGLRRDKDDFVFVLTVNTGRVAMVLIHKNGEEMVNEVARAFLQATWKLQYESNMRQIIPVSANDLSQDCFALTGVKIRER